jgi:hypothetical protein
MAAPQIWEDGPTPKQKPVAPPLCPFAPKEKSHGWIPWLFKL